MYFNFRRAKRAVRTALGLGLLTVLGLAAISYYQDEPTFSIFGRQSFEETMQEAKANKPKAMKKHMNILEERYNLTPKTTKEVTMSRGKPIPVGPTAKLKQGTTWESLAQMPPAAIKEKGVFPYLPLSHPLPDVGGMVFPPVQTRLHPELVRFDVDFDLPDAFLPEFPPALFLTSRPDLGDVSQGKEITQDNFYAMFKDILTPVQLEGLRLLVTRFPQQQFNLTDDRKSERPSQGVACFDCHVNGHTTGQFHLNPDNRPQAARFRIDTVSLRGVNIQRLHGSKRSLRSIEDFTEFEQRSAYFDGDQTLAAKKGINPLAREQVMHMAQFQNMIDFPPALKLNLYGRLDRTRAAREEIRGEELFFGKAKCWVCHPAPYYTDNSAHDLKVERFYDGRAEGPIKTFTLRGLKDSPPYLHDGRLLTIEDAVEFFNLVQELKLSEDEKKDLVKFLRTL